MKRRSIYDPLCRGASIIFLVLSVTLIAFVVCGCGGDGDGQSQGEVLDLEELWSRACQADASLDSWRMTIDSYYENTQYGSGQIQSIAIEVSGDDVYERDLLMGQSYYEYKRVAGRQYIWDARSGTWKETTEELGREGEFRASSQFPELPTLATSQEYMGRETIGGREAEHFHLLLDASGVKQMFSATTSMDFSQNGGGEVDLWIDSREFYLLRYELLIRSVILPQNIGRADMRFVVNIEDINQPITIEAPEV